MAAVTDTLKLFLAGDVMTARGIDSVLPHPGDPRLYEACVKGGRLHSLGWQLGVRYPARASPVRPCLDRRGRS